MTGAEALARARAVTEVPFRLHGRAPDRGFDCVGLVAYAWRVDAPTGYAMRGAPRDRIERVLGDLGFVPADPLPGAPGAVALIAAGPGQLHLGVATGAGVIHADAAARCVVERAAPLPWPILAAWIR
ncbi:MAG: peptidoglycan endopeptidase [Pseudomonadota bacterium]